MKRYLPFLSIWLITAAVVYLAGSVAPDYYVLGSHLVSDSGGSVITGFLITAFCWAAKPIVASLNVKLEGRYKMFVFYWLSNAIAIWLVARFAPYTGLGISAYHWALALGFVASFVQWGVWQVLKAKDLI